MSQRTLPAPPPYATSSVRVVPRPGFGTRLRQRWGLVLATGLGGLVIGNALFQPWLSTTLIVSPVKSDSREYGLGQSGVWGILLAVGLIVVFALVVAALVAPEPTSGMLALTALTGSVALAVEMVFLALRLGAARTASGRLAAEMLESMGDQIRDVWFLVHMPAPYAAASGLALLALVAAQVSRPDLGVSVLAVSGAVAGVVSLVVPWATAYLPDDGGLVIDRHWVWSVGGVGVPLGLATLLLVALGVAVPLGLRVSLPLMLGVVVVGFVVLWAPVTIEETKVLESQLTDPEPMSLPLNASPRFMEFAALLVSIAAVRAWRGARRERRSASAGGTTGSMARGRVQTGQMSPGSVPTGLASTAPAPAVAGSPAWPTAR